MRFVLRRWRIRVSSLKRIVAWRRGGMKCGLVVGMRASSGNRGAVVCFDVFDACGWWVGIVVCGGGGVQKMLLLLLLL